MRVKEPWQKYKIKNILWSLTMNNNSNVDMNVFRRKVFDSLW